MENLEVLSPLNNVLTVKSAAILRCVSKITNYYIKPKEYSFYKIFKKLYSFNFRVDIVDMLFESDQIYLDNFDSEEYFYPIENHYRGKQIKEYVYKYYYQCISDFLHNFNNFSEAKNAGLDLLITIADHCGDYDDNSRLLCGILIELCLEEYNNYYRSIENTCWCDCENCNNF